jgi:hypothetical protein
MISKIENNIENKVPETTSDIDLIYPTLPSDIPTPDQFFKICAGNEKEEQQAIKYLTDNWNDLHRDIIQYMTEVRDDDDRDIHILNDVIKDNYKVYTKSREDIISILKKGRDMMRKFVSHDLLKSDTPRKAIATQEVVNPRMAGNVIKLQHVEGGLTIEGVCLERSEQFIILVPKVGSPNDIDKWRIITKSNQTTLRRLSQTIKYIDKNGVFYMDGHPEGSYIIGAIGSMLVSSKEACVWLDETVTIRMSNCEVVVIPPLKLSAIDFSNILVPTREKLNETPNEIVFRSVDSVADLDDTNVPDYGHVIYFTKNLTNYKYAYYSPAGLTLLTQFKKLEVEEFFSLLTNNKISIVSVCTYKVEPARHIGHNVVITAFHNVDVKLREYQKTLRNLPLNWIIKQNIALYLDVDAIVKHELNRINSWEISGIEEIPTNAVETTFEIGPTAPPLPCTYFPATYGNLPFKAHDNGKVHMMTSVDKNKGVEYVFHVTNGSNVDYIGDTVCLLNTTLAGDRMEEVNEYKLTYIYDVDQYDPSFLHYEIVIFAGERSKLK